MQSNWLKFAVDEAKVYILAEDILLLYLAPIMVDIIIFSSKNLAQLYLNFAQYLKANVQHLSCACIVILFIAYNMMCNVLCRKSTKLPKFFFRTMVAHIV